MTTQKFNTLFSFEKKSIMKAGEGLDSGNHPFFTSSPILSKRTNWAQYFSGALIFGTGGHANIHYANEPFATSTDCLVTTTKQKNLNVKFVYYYLFGNIHLLERGFKGAGLKHISKKYIENLDIPILPIETQNKIVAILDNASALVSKREETIKHLDNLLYATFLKQFGHLINNPSAKTIEELQNNIADDDKINYGVVQPGEDFPGGIPIVRVGDFEDSYINPLSLKTIDPEIHKRHKNSILNGGEVLIACVGATIGKVALVEDSFKGFNIVRATARINCGPKIINTYLLNLLLSDYYQHQLKILSRTVAQPTLNIKQIEELKIPIPPIEEQIIFDKFYHTLIASKKKSKESLQIIKELSNSISQKIFNGTINFKDADTTTGNINLRADLSLNIDFELEVLIKEISLIEKSNDLSKIASNPKYLKRLIEKLNSQEFKEKDLYDKAKHAVFQLMAVKEEPKVIQKFDTNSKSLKLAIK